MYYRLHITKWTSCHKFYSLCIFVYIPSRTNDTINRLYASRDLKSLRSNCFGNERRLRIWQVVARGSCSVYQNSPVQNGTADGTLGGLSEFLILITRFFG